MDVFERTAKFLKCQRREALDVVNYMMTIKEFNFFQASEIEWEMEAIKSYDALINTTWSKK